MSLQNIWGQLNLLTNQGVLTNLMAYGIGKRIFLDPANGNDLLDGLAPTNTPGSASGPVQTLAAAYALATAGKNDIIFLLADGTTAATARVDAAFTWAKSETHLIGVCSPVIYGQRARIAPTPSVTAFANFFTISGSGCIFSNVEWFQGFTTGIAGTEIGMTITGSRNYFNKCQIVGMADTDAASAGQTGSRHIKISGGGENLFEDCVIGADTFPRNAANASIEFAGGTTRNVFRRCIIPIYATNAGVLGILGTGNSCVDRFNEFRDCTFTNAIKSAATQMTVLGSFTTAAPGGAIIFSGWTFSIGATKLGDTNFLANSYVCGPAPNSGAFLGIVPA